MQSSNRLHAVQVELMHANPFWQPLRHSDGGAAQTPEEHSPPAAQSDVVEQVHCDAVCEALQRALGPH